MTWFKVDDSFYDHPKVFDAPDCAVALWTRAGTWSARNLTDGFVPTGMPARLCDDPDTAVKELVRRGLWLRATGGWRFHDWATYQPSKTAVEDLRSKRAEAGKRGGQAKAAKQNASNGLANASDVGKQNAAPSRPVPSPSGLGSGFSNGETSSILEPPSKCDQHINDDDPPPCGRCGEARRARERWDVEQAQRQRHETAVAKSASAKERAALIAAEIRNCPRCDHLGRLPSQAVCNHEPEATKAAELSAAARAAIRPPVASRQRADPIALARQRDPESPLDAALAEVIPIRPSEAGEP